jgi:hypothetical protein
MSDQNKQVIDWVMVTDHFTTGKITKIEQFASMFNVSRPTAKKMLEEYYGNRILFKRGRNGGIVFNAAAVPVMNGGNP